MGLQDLVHGMLIATAQVRTPNIVKHRQSIAMWGGTGVKALQCCCRTWLDKILAKGNHTNVDAVRMQSVFSSVSRDN